jgi:hypothetical protein
MGEQTPVSQSNSPDEPLPTPYPVLQHFAFGHLPDHLAAISSPFSELAYWMADNLPEGPETAAGLRKLLEAKDCAVRANLTGRSR